MNPTRRAESTHATAEDRQGPPTILLVDDADQIRELITMILRNGGYTVLEAKDGNACVKIVQEYPGSIHLLLADMLMPGMTGREVADHLLPVRQRMKVLFMSGQSIGTIPSHGGFDPPFGFIQKPFTPETLLRKVAETLGT